jgi:hypothetical protein
VGVGVDDGLTVGDKVGVVVGVGVGGGSVVRVGVGVTLGVSEAVRSISGAGVRVGVTVEGRLQPHKPMPSNKLMNNPTLNRIQERGIVHPLEIDSTHRICRPLKTATNPAP